MKRTIFKADNDITRLIRAINAMGLTQPWISRKLDIPLVTIRTWMQGVRPNNYVPVKYMLTQIHAQLKKELDKQATESTESKGKKKKIKEKICDQNQKQ